MSNALPFKMDGIYCKLIPLTQGQFAIVDADDFNHLNQMRWCAWWNPKTESYYAVTRLTRVDGKSVTIHMQRYLCFVFPRTDHRNMMTLDNRRTNLRPSTHGQNMFNREKQSNNKSGFKGVCYAENVGKYVAQLVVDGRRVLCEYFTTAAQAARAYDDAALIYHGEFARTNFARKVAV